MTAAEKILGKALAGSNLDTAGWSAIQAGLRDRAFFSSKVEDARILHEARRMCAEVADGKRAASEFRRDMRTLLSRMGHPQGDGGLTDLYSQKRLDVLLDTNVRQARGYIQYREGCSEGALMAFPAQELVRVQAREKPRDWEERWVRAGGRFHGGRMVALKNDPIWTAISAFGTPWPPFDFNSGMGVEDIDFESAVELGLIQEDTPIPEPEEMNFNEGLEAEVDFDDVSAEWAGLKETFGDQIQLVDGKVQWRGDAIRENFEKGGEFTMRLGTASESLLQTLSANEETQGFVSALEGQTQLCLTQHWLDRKREDGTDHRAHFEPLEAHPDSTPLTIGDIELIPSIWRNPDRVYDAGAGCVALETDSLSGDMYRLIVKIAKSDGRFLGAPDVKTFYRTNTPYQRKRPPHQRGADGAEAPTSLGVRQQGQATTSPKKGKAE